MAPLRRRPGDGSASPVAILPFAETPEPRMPHGIEQPAEVDGESPLHAHVSIKRYNHPRMPRVTQDVEILHAALIGYQRELARIDSKMAEIRRWLGDLTPAAPNATTASAKRVLSEEARRRIAAAQKKRWAAFRNAKEPPVRPVAKKRTMSAAGKKRIAEANRKRWAAFRAQKAKKSAVRKPAVKKTARAVVGNGAGQAATS
jgi:hypothetical protein